MQRKDSKLDFTGQEIYVGIDTGKKSWKVCILTEELDHGTFTQPPRPAALVDHHTADQTDHYIVQLNSGRCSQ